MNWQTPAALAVVALTAIIFLLRSFRNARRGKSSCGTTTCACPKK